MSKIRPRPPSRSKRRARMPAPAPRPPVGLARARRTYPEAALHRQVADYLRAVLPLEVVWTTFPAGGGGRVRGAKLRAAGLQAGWPDLLLIWPRDPRVQHEGPHARILGLELKAPRGSVSPEQRACHARLRVAGVAVWIARSVAEVEQILRVCSVPMRGRVAA